MGPLFEIDSTFTFGAPVGSNGHAPSRFDHDAVTAALATPRTLGYKPSLPVQSLLSADGLFLPQQFYSDVEQMVADPVVVSPYNTFRSGVTGADFEVDASDANIAQFADDTIHEFWERSLSEVQLGYDYGWVGAEVMYRQEGGQLRFDGLKAFAPRDVAPLTLDGELMAVRVRNVTDERGQSLELWGPKHAPAKGYWYAHRPRYHPWYGRSQLWPAWKPFKRLTGRDGAEEVIDGGVYRFAYAGPAVYFPEGSFAANRQAPGPARQDNRDIARNIAESAKTGASFAIPSVYDANGNQLWKLEWPDRVLNVDPLLNYAQALADHISLGIGVPPELIQASEVGSGYSGRQIPLEGFYLGQQEIGRAILEGFVRQVLMPLIRWNFGRKAWARVKLNPLLETRKKQSGGGPEQPGESPTGDDPGTGQDQPNSDGGNSEAPPAKSGSPWQPYQGKRGGHGRLNTATGKVDYSKRMATADPANDHNSDNPVRSLDVRRAAEPRAVLPSATRPPHAVEDSLDAADGSKPPHTYGPDDDLAMLSTGPHKFGSTQFNLPPDVAEIILALGRQIPDDELATDGRENEPHITAKYGIHTDDAEEVRRVVEGAKPIQAKLGRVAIFPAKEAGSQRGGADYDVVYVEVVSPDLHRLNRLLCDGLEFTDSHPNYVPHICLAYVKAGEGAKYVGITAVAGLEMVLDRLVFSAADGRRTEIELLGVPAEPVMLATDATGHQHKGTGEGGGQFTGSGGAGGSAAATTASSARSVGLRIAQAVVAVEHKAKSLLSATVDKLPGRLPALVKGAYRLSMLTYDAGYEAAQGAAESRGLSDEQAQRVGQFLAIGDLLGMKALPALLGAVGLGGGVMAAGSFVPVASLCYLGYSVARRPTATINAARRAIKSIRATVHLATDQQPLAELLADRFAAAGEREDWYQALLAAALDQSRDLRAAVALADEAFAQQTNLATIHAPAGGITIKGKTFTGGEFIPNEDLAKANPSQKQELIRHAVGQLKGAKKERASRGDLQPARREDTEVADAKGKAKKQPRLVFENGSQVPDTIPAGKVPAAWKDVRVSTNPDDDVWVTAVDAKGRTKTVYSDSYEMRQAAIKFARGYELTKKADEVAAQIQSARQSDDKATVEAAACMWLIQEQATRPGSDKDTKAKVKAYGATTLRGEHVVEADDGVRLQFVGKEGIWHDHLIRNQELAKELLRRKVAAGDDGKLFDTTDAKLLKFSKQLDSGRFTAKDFRSLKATQMAADLVAAMPKPADAKGLRSAMMDVADKVSRVLGNKAQQAIESYINPMIWSGWSLAS